jgi:16S rRNA (cytosine1402-N4)-methyltransferase
LRATWSALRPHGRIAVITFHSIEDREVKQIMREWQKNGEGKLVSKKPIMPTNEEMRENPRARSAKLRVVERL